MNSSRRSPHSPRSLRFTPCPVPVSLSWSHFGVPYRVTPWPEVRFERLYDEDWIAVSPAEDVLASAALACGQREWTPFLEFVPAPLRDFLIQFGFVRMEVLQVVARCPALVPELIETPALTAFVAAHVALRGTPAPGWAEIEAVHERNGLFGVLEWLGLPASRQTVAVLRNLVSPEVPKRYLDPLRQLLWEPQTSFVLQRTPEITDRHLARYCHPLAA